MKERSEVERLMSEHWPLARRGARKLARQLGEASGVTREDCEAAALVALWHLIEAWDPDRGVPLARYLASRLRNRLVDWLREEGPSRRNGSRRWEQKQLSQLEPRDAARLVTHAACRDREMDRLLLRDEVETELRRLTPASRIICRLYYLDELSMQEIGQRMGTCGSRISQRLGRLRGEMVCPKNNTESTS